MGGGLIQWMLSPMTVALIQGAGREYKRIAVKMVDDRGLESLLVLEVWR